MTHTKPVVVLLAAPLAAAIAAASLSGCTRTYDGSIVPTYQTSFARDGLMPRMVFKRTPVDPAYPLGSYPAQPRAPRAEARAEDAVPARVRRRAAPARVAAVAADPAPRKPLSCRRETTPSGRVLVACE